MASDSGDPLKENTQTNGELIQRFASLPDEGIGQAPVHITRVTPDTVTVTSGTAINTPKPWRIVQKVSDVLKKEPDGEAMGSMKRLAEGNPSDQASRIPRSPVIMQGPPPSPPISEVEVVESTEDNPTSSSLVSTEPTEHIEPVELNGVPLPAATEARQPVLTQSPSVFGFSKGQTLYTSNLTAEPTEFAPPGPAKSSPAGPSHLGVPAARQVSNSSTASRTGSLAVVRSGRLASQRNASPSETERDGGGSFEDGSALNKSKEGAYLPDEEDDVPLAPWFGKAGGSSSSRPSTSTAPVSPPMIFRRSTNPTPSPNPIRSPLIHAHSTFLPSPSGKDQTLVPGLEGAALDSDIIAQAATIRRERLERRQKKASLTDGTLEGGEIREKSEVKESKKVEETRVLVGNLIGEDHVNYVLMYNMLTGIRIGVSRVPPLYFRADD